MFVFSTLYCWEIILQDFQAQTAFVSGPASYSQAKKLILRRVHFYAWAGKCCKRDRGTSPNLPGVLLLFFLPSVFSSLFSPSSKNCRNLFNVTFFSFPLSPSSCFPETSDVEKPKSWNMMSPLN